MPDPRAAGRLAVQLVGRPRFRDASGQWKDLRGKEPALLLRVIVCGPIRRQVLLDELWPAEDHADPRSNLRSALHALRKRGGDPLLSGDETLSLSREVEHDLASLLAPPPLPGAPWQDDAAAAPRELLEGFAFPELPDFDAWLSTQRRRWREAVRRVWSRQAAEHERAGRADALAALADRLLAVDAHDELACRWRMRALAMQGDKAAARRVVDRLEQHLRREGGRATELATRLLALAIELDEPLPAMEPLPSGAGAVRLPAGVFGRDAELAELGAAIDRCARVVLEGESGIGKSLLLEQALNRQGVVVKLDCRPGSEAQPFGLLMRLLMALDQAIPGRPAANRRWPAVARAELARLVGAWGEPPRSPARSDRLVEALQQALMHSHADGLRVLAIDDLHRADDASLKLIVPALLATPDLAVVLSLQPAARPAALRSALEECPHAFETQRLQAMTARAMAQLVGALPLRLPHRQAWGEMLASRSLGNPMHAIEWLRHLQLHHGDAVFLEPPPAADEHTEEPFARLLEERLSRLPPSARHLAQWAALAGVLFDAALAQSLTGHSLPRLGDDWQQLRNENIFDERGLAHDALREPLLRPLPAGLLREMHAQVAALCAVRAAPAAALAPHWRAAGRWREAARCFGEAAASALSLGASETACTLSDEAAAAHEQIGAWGEAFGARLLALEAARASREHSETEQRADELLKRAGQLDATARAVALEARARVDLSRWDFGAALQSAEAAWAEVGHSPEAAPSSSPRVSDGAAGKLALRIRASLAGALAGLGRMAEAQALIDEDREAVRRSGDDRLRMDHAGMLGYVLLHGSRVQEAERALREALAIAHRLDDAAETMTLASNAAQTVLRQGRTREALDLALDAVIESRRLGRASGVAIGSALITAGGIRLQIGQYRQALQDLDGARQALGSALAGAWLDATTSFKVQTLVELGQAEKAFEALEARHAEVADAPTQKPRVRLLFARYVIDKALGTRTDAELIESLRTLQALTSHADAALGFVYQNELALWLPADEALDLARDVASRASGKGFMSAHAAARVRAAQALARLGRADEAHGTMQAVLQDLPTCQPLFVTLPALWWVAGEVAQAAGMPEQAAHAWRRGRAWLMEQALPNVPEGFQASFLDGHPVHRRLNAAGQ